MPVRSRSRSSSSRSEEPLLEAQLARLRGRNRDLELLQLRGTVALARRERLLAHVIFGHARSVALADFDRVTERADILDLQRFDAGAFALAFLELPIGRAAPRGAIGATARSKSRSRAPSAQGYCSARPS